VILLNIELSKIYC